MSNAMFAAIRKRKMMTGTHEPDHGKEHEALSKTSDEQSEKVQDHTQNIAKGHASPKEQEKIAQKMAEPPEGAEADEGQSDDIAKSMLDSRFRQGVPDGMKARNLSDRMKMNLADKLKAKGKL